MPVKDFIFGIGNANIILVLLVVILTYDEEPKTTWMWIMVMSFMPGLGFILYLFIGQDYKKIDLFNLKIKEDKEINKLAIRQREIIKSGTIEEDLMAAEVKENLRKYEELIELNLMSDQAIMTTDNKVDVFFWGDEKFSALLTDLENAQTYIDMQYYIFRSDQIGKRILTILAQKAREGVRVRLLIDSVGGKDLKKKDLEELKAAGAKVEFFFPALFNLVQLRLNYRNHRKIVIIDDKVGYIGGFNVGDDYLGKYKSMGPWRDTHIRIEGSSIDGLNLRFLKDWHHASGEETLESDHVNFDQKGPGSAGVQIVTSGLDTEFENIKNAICKMFTSAQEEIIIQTPYFIPDETIMDLLKLQLSAGIKVRIMIPGNPDHPFVFPAGIFYLSQLVKIGAEVYLYEYGFIHSKNIMVDDDLLTIGSANMDIRSFKLNFEANAIIYDKDLNKKLRDQFEEDIKKSRLLTYEAYLERPLTFKVKETISKLLSPLL